MILFIVSLLFYTNISVGNPGIDESYPYSEYFYACVSGRYFNGLGYVSSSHPVSECIDKCSKRYILVKMTNLFCSSKIESKIIGHRCSAFLLLFLILTKRGHAVWDVLVEIMTHLPMLQCWIQRYTARTTLLKE